MEKKKALDEKELDDEMLDKVSGGFDDYDLCEWSPTGAHEWELDQDLHCLRCKYCGIRM